MHSITPLMPPRRDHGPSGFALLSGLGKSIVGIWPRAAYEEAWFKLDLFGRKKIFLFNDPAAIKRILVDEVDRFPRSPIRNRIIKPLIGNGLVIAEGEEWRAQRQSLAPAFTPRAIEALSGKVRRAVDRRVDALPAQGTEVDLSVMTQDLVLEVVVEIFLSLDIGGKAREMKKLGDAYARYCAAPDLFDMLCPPGMPTPRHALRLVLARRWKAFIEDMIDLRIKASHTEGEGDLFELIYASIGNGAPANPRQSLIDQVSTMVTGGNETTSLGAFWTLYLLAQCQDLQEELRVELLSGGTRHEPFIQGPLLSATIQESLRLYPTNFMIARHANEDNVVSGAEIPRGSVVMVIPWILHRHGAYWEDPDRFAVDRFLPDAPPPQKYAYLPYSTGPRRCIGVHLANLIIAQVVASLLVRFRLHLTGPADALPSLIVLARPDRPAPTRLAPT